jgi:hypothetical protein
MSLPSSGEIKASQMNTVAGRSATANAPLSGSSSTPQTGSLVKIYATASPPVNQSAPHAFSEFYGRSFATLTSFLVGAGIVEGGNTACNTLGSSFTYYHDGSGTYPATGDIVYTNSGGTTPASGGTGTNYAVFAAGPPAPPVRYFRITGSTGTVQATSTCP